MSASYQQGSDVRRLAAQLGLEGNVPFAGCLVSGSSAECDGLAVTVVGPSAEALKDLADRWRAAVEANDADVVASAFRDRSVPNLSSIALHIRSGEHTALLTGDARGDHLLGGLEAAGLADPKGLVRVDLLKLPHHGSANNAAPSLFERVHANHYVISADGVAHKHPAIDTLRWLVESRGPAEEFTVYLTNKVEPALEELSRLQLGRRFNIAVRSKLVDSIVVELGGD